MSNNEKLLSQIDALQEDLLYAEGKEKERIKTAINKLKRKVKK